jgi:hypothetical protein
MPAQGPVGLEFAKGKMGWVLRAFQTTLKLDIYSLGFDDINARKLATHFL